MTSPRILLWDIETARMKLELETYQLKQYSKYLPSEAIVRDIWMPCAAWKWMHEPYVASTSVLQDRDRFEACYWDDYHVVKTLHELINGADILIAHNGDNFDWKMFNVRCIHHGLEPPPKPIMIDTLKAARKEFKFASNKLSYLAKFLDVSLKDDSPNWGLVSSGDAEEIASCERYCRGDIRALEGVYLKLRPFMTNHPNLNVMMDGTHHNCCPSCGHWDLEKRGTQQVNKEGRRLYVSGYRFTGAGKYQRYKCNRATGGCGANAYKSKNLTKAEIR